MTKALAKAERARLKRLSGAQRADLACNPIKAAAEEHAALSEDSSGRRPR
jgi:hypothetical protein